MNDTNLNFTAKTRQFGVRTLDYIKNKGKQNLIIASATIILFFVFALLNPNFLNPITIRTMVKSATPYVILALGVTFVIATGGIDLSIGTVTIASAALGGKMFMMGVPLWLVLIFMILIGTLFGIINGFLVANLKLPPFIATLGTMMFSRGISAIIIVQPNVQFPQGSWLQKAFTDYNGFPMGLIWIALFTVICMILMYKSKAGRYILAVGSNEQATRLSGVKSDNYKMLAYVLCGMFAGIASIFFATNSIQIAGASGNGMELDAIAGVYIGGTSAAGGIASVFGSVIGSFMLVIIRNGLNMVLLEFNVNVNSTYLTYVITGLIVVGAVLMDVIKNKNLEKVKTEKQTKKLKKITREKIEKLRLELDYLKSDKNISKEEKQQHLISYNQQIALIKQDFHNELPKAISEDKRLKEEAILKKQNKKDYKKMFKSGE